MKTHTHFEIIVIEDWKPIGGVIRWKVDIVVLIADDANVVAHAFLVSVQIEENEVCSFAQRRMVLGFPIHVMDLSLPSWCGGKTSTEQQSAKKHHENFSSETTRRPASLDKPNIHKSTATKIFQW